MKSPSPNRRSRVGAALSALTLLGMLFWGGTALAAGTVSGTDINNLSKLTFSVGTVPQNAICSSPTGNSTSNGDTGAAACVTGSNGAVVTTFKVDNKVNLSVLEVGGAVTSVVPGSTNQVTTFSVTNLGNTAQGYTLAAANQTAASAVILAVADSIDVSNVRVFVESGANAGYQPLEDIATAILTLAPDATVTVYVVADVPVTATNGQQANVTLTATTTTTGTATAVLETTGANTAGVDIVFADPATTELGFVGTSALRDAQGTARDAYRIASAVISVSKTATPICDPFNGSTNPKNIPGAAVQYSITITNAAGATASATLSQIADALDVANLTFDPGLISGVGAGASCVAGTGNQAPAIGFGAVRGTGTTTTTYVAPGPNSTAQAVTAGATFASPNVTINFATLTGTAYGAANPVLPANSFITVYFNAFVK